MPMDEIMNLHEVADYLRVNPSTIYRLLKRKELTSFKVGRDHRFSRPAIDAWMVQQAKVSRTAAYRSKR